MKYMITCSYPLPLTHCQHRTVESTDARMFGLDDAEVAKRRKYVVYVWKTIEVRPIILLLLFTYRVLMSRDCKSRT